MIFRSISRWPGRSAATALGMSFAVAIMMGAGFFRDALDKIIETDFTMSTRQDAVLVFSVDQPERALHAKICCVEIRSPISGTVLAVDTISEHAVGPRTRLLSVGQSDNLEIVADLLSSDAVRLTLGAEATVERWGGPQPLRARIRSIEPSARTEVSALGVDEQRVYATLDFLSPSPDRIGLGDGFSVFLRIIKWSGDDLLQVPLSAVFRDSKSWAVFVVDDNGLVRKSKVELGRRNGSFAHVVTGLVDGQREPRRVCRRLILVSYAIVRCI